MKERLKIVGLFLLLLLVTVSLGFRAAANIDLVPNAEVDLTPIALADANDGTMTFTTAANFVQVIPDNASAVILLVKADGDFYEGQAATSSSLNVLREGNVWHAIPVAGRTAWHFRRAGGSTVTIKGKLLLGT